MIRDYCEIIIVCVLRWNVTDENSKYTPSKLVKYLSWNLLC